MWRMDFDPATRRLCVQLKEHVSTAHLRELADAHTLALEATGGQAFKVFLDLRGLFPLEPDAVVLLGAIKRLASQMRGWAGTAVLADSATVAMQQNRTRICEQTDVGLELVSLSSDQVERFLAS